MSQPANSPQPDGTAKVSVFEKRKKIYAKGVRGLFDNWRIALVIFTQILFYVSPWLVWNGRQAILLHLVERKFYIFGMVFWPQDVIYLAALLIVSAYALFLVTAVAGRLFCGYACPQTVYTQIFMWIENKIEGDRNARIKLDKSTGARKLRIKATKHFVWLLFSLWTGFTLVCYFTPVTELIHNVMTNNLGSWEIFWIFFYGGFTYLFAGFMREQVCKYLCPYARFQSAMFDKDTLIITYDVERGEPRGSRSRKADHKSLGLGACVDCSLCVQVCPTGIDIRQGLQYECIGCAACIDVCDGVMDKMGYARGLVRYDTQNGVQHHLGRGHFWRRVLRPRVLVYSGILLLILAALLTSLVLRTPFKVDVVRDRASLARVVDEGRIENIYRLQVMNATESTHHYRLAVEGMPGIRLDGPSEVDLTAAEAKWVTLNVQVPPETASSAGSGAHPIRFRIELMEDGAGPAVAASISEKSTFVVPR